MTNRKIGTGTMHRGINVMPADQAWRGGERPPNAVDPHLYLIESSIVVGRWDDLPPILVWSEAGFNHAFDWCYGLPLVADPRDFYPDPHVTSQQQLMEHHSACVAIENGMVPMGLADYPPFVNPWGIGISLLPKGASLVGPGTHAVNLYIADKWVGFLASHNQVNRLRIHAVVFPQADAEKIAAEITADPDEEYTAKAKPFYKKGE